MEVWESLWNLRKVVGLEARGDFLAPLRLAAKPLRKPEFDFKLFSASQA